MWLNVVYDDLCLHVIDYSINLLEWLYLVENNRFLAAVFVRALVTGVMLHETGDNDICHARLGRDGY